MAKQLFFFFFYCFYDWSMLGIGKIGLMENEENVLYFCAGFLVKKSCLVSINILYRIRNIKT